MGKRTFKIKDEEGNVRTSRLKDKLVCAFADGREVIMGESEEGTFAVQLTNPTDSTRYPIQGVHLTEGSLIAFYATMCIYFNQKGIDPNELYKKYLPEGHENGVPCNFQTFDENDTEE